LTWLRKWPQLNWIYTDAAGAAAALAGELEKLPQTPLQVALKYLEEATI
jgi:hypothetical protein